MKLKFKKHIRQHDLYHSLNGRSGIGWLTMLVLLFFPRFGSGQVICNNCPTGSTMFTKGTFPKECASTAPTYFSVDPAMHWEDCNFVNPWMTVPKDYTLSDNASEWNGNWDKTSHTADGSALLLIDGPKASDGDKRVWIKTVSVQAGRVYKMEAWVSNVHTGITGVDPDFFLQVDGSPLTVGNVSASNIVWGSATSWTPLCGLYTSCVTGTVELSIVMKGKGPTNAGNDGAIDDVTFKPVANPIADLTYVPPVCNEPIDFTINQFDPANSYNFEFGDGSSGTVIVSNFSHPYPGPGMYDLKFSVTSPCGGTTTVIHKINIKGCCDCTVCDNLVGNPHFSEENCGELYSTEMTQDQCPAANETMIPGEIGEAQSSTAVWSNWCAEDHTGEEGSKLLIIDGPTVAMGNKVAWKQTGPTNNNTGYTVTPGMKYCFSAFVVNLDKVDPHFPSFSLHLKADGIDYVIAEITNLASNEGCCWQRVCGSWIAPAGVTNVQELFIVINGGSGIGNDLGIDDISFGLPCEQEMIRPGGSFEDEEQDMGNTPAGTDQKCLACGPDANNLQVMPVPVHAGDPLTVNYTPSVHGLISITIYDMNGKVLLNESKQVHEQEKVSLILQTSNLAPGTYILKIYDGKVLQAKQFIVQ